MGEDCRQGGGMRRCATTGEGRLQGRHRRPTAGPWEETGGGVEGDRQRDDWNRGQLGEGALAVLLFCDGVRQRVEPHEPCDDAGRAHHARGRWRRRSDVVPLPSSPEMTPPAAPRPSLQLPPLDLKDRGGATASWRLSRLSLDNLVVVDARGKRRRPVQRHRHLRRRCRPAGVSTAVGGRSQLGWASARGMAARPRAAAPAVGGGVGAAPEGNKGGWGQGG